MQSLWLIFVVFFLLLLIIPFSIKVYASYDLFNNLGAISIYVFFIKIFAYKVTFKNNKILLYTQKDTKQVPIQLSDKKLRFLEQIIIQLKEKIVIKNATVFTKIGLNDAYHTALMSGTVNAIISIIFARIKNKKKSAKLKIVDMPYYNGNSFILSANGIVSITLFDILYGIFFAIIVKKRSEKYERI